MLAMNINNGRYFYVQQFSLSFTRIRRAKENRLGISETISLTNAFYAFAKFAHAHRRLVVGSQYYSRF